MHSLLVYLKSFLDFLALIFSRFSSSIKKTSLKSNNLLFINTGQIGDLIISSSILENDEILNEYPEVYFLIDQEYISLFQNYSGKIKIISVNIRAYKYNLIYRIKFNGILQKLRVTTVYNLTSVRPIWNDTLALCIKADKAYSYENNWTSLVKIRKKYIESLYTKQLAKNIFNEYDRIDFLLNRFRLNGDKLFKITQKSIFINDETVSQYDLILAPFSTSPNKEWGIDNFKKLLLMLENKMKILLLGSHKQKEGLIKIKDQLHNVDIAAGDIPLNKLFSYLNKAKIYIGLDSGISHLALKTKVKSIILVGGGTYGMYFPKPNDKKTIYLTEKLSCFHCNWHCTFDTNFCLSKITTEQVLEHIKVIYENS